MLQGVHHLVAPSSTAHAEDPARIVGPLAMGGIVLAVLGIVAGVDPAGLVPHGPLRWLLTTAGLLLAAAGLRGPLVVPRRAAACWLALLTTLAVAAVAALDPLHAWIGTPDRRLGLLAWAGMAVAWLVGTAVARAGRTAWLARVLVLATLVTAAGGALSALGWAPDDGVTGRIGGLSGSPAHLGALLVLLVPVCVGISLGGHARWRRLGAVAALAGTVTLAATLTRGAWLGLLLGAAVVVPGWPGRLRTGVRRRRVASSLLVLAGVLTVALTPVGPRLGEMISGEGTVRGRLDEWAVAVRVIGDHPITGTGPEGYRIAFPGAVDADYGRRYGRAVAVDRAHSSILDVTAAGGFPAGAAWLAMLAMLTLAARRTAREGPVLAGLAVAVVGYAAQQLVLFPLAEVDPLWWVLAGVVTARAHGTVIGLSPLPLRGTAAATLGLVLVVGLQGVVADRDMAAAARLSEDDPTTASALAGRAAARRPDDIRLWFAAGRIAARAPMITGLDTALDRIDAALRRSPADPVLRAEQASLLADRAGRSQLPEDAAAAAAAHRDLLAGDPTNASLWAGLGRVQLLQGDRDGAGSSLEAALALDPGAEGVDALAARLALPDEPGEENR